MKEKKGQTQVVTSPTFRQAKYNITFLSPRLDTYNLSLALKKLLQLSTHLELNQASIQRNEMMGGKERVKSHGKFVRRKFLRFAYQVNE